VEAIDGDVGDQMTARLADALIGAGAFTGAPARPPGVYRWRSRAHQAAVRRELAAVGWGLHVLAGHRVTGAPELFERCAAELAFPGWFRHTFEALADGLGDLSWLAGSGHVLLWEQYGVLARADPKAWRQAYEVMAEAIAARDAAGAVPLYVLVRGGPAGGPLPPLFAPTSLHGEHRETAQDRP
jgi:hypothetical protein